MESSSSGRRMTGSQSEHGDGQAAPEENHPEQQERPRLMIKLEPGGAQLRQRQQFQGEDDLFDEVGDCRR